MSPLPPHPQSSSNPLSHVSAFSKILLLCSFLLLLSSPLSCIHHPLPESALCCSLVSHFTSCVPVPPTPILAVWKSARNPPSRLCCSRPLYQNPGRELCVPQSVPLQGWQVGVGGGQTAHNLIAFPCSLTPQRNHTFHLVVVRNNMLKKPGITKLLN